MWWKRKQPSVDCTQPTGHPGPCVGAAVEAEVGGYVVAGVGGGYEVGAAVGAGHVVESKDKEYENANWSIRNMNIVLLTIFFQ